LMISAARCTSLSATGKSEKKWFCQQFVSTVCQTVISKFFLCIPERKFFSVNTIITFRNPPPLSVSIQYLHSFVTHVRCVNLLVFFSGTHVLVEFQISEFLVRKLKEIFMYRKIQY
jgi:hypothetical protein